MRVIPTSRRRGPTLRGRAPPFLNTAPVHGLVACSGGQCECRGSRAPRRRGWLGLAAVDWMRWADAVCAPPPPRPPNVWGECPSQVRPVLDRRGTTASAVVHVRLERANVCVTVDPYDMQSVGFAFEVQFRRWYPRTAGSSRITVGSHAHCLHCTDSLCALVMRSEGGRKGPSRGGGLRAGPAIEEG